MSIVKQSLIIIAALAVSATMSPVAAQRGVGQGQGLQVNGIGPRLGENIALALENRDRLGLSEDQVAGLQLLQAGVAEDVTPLQTEVDALRTRMRAGEVSYTAGIPQLRGLLAELDIASEPYRAGVADILTADQHLELQEIMWSTRPYDAGWYSRAGFGYGVQPRVGTGFRPRGGFGRGAAWGGRGRGLLRGGHGAGWRW